MTSAGITFFFNWEVALEEWLQSVLGNFGISVISFFSAFGEELLLIGVMGFLYWCWDKKFGKFVAANFMVAALLNPMIKNIVHRRRPYFDNEGIKCLRAVDSEADIYDIAAQGYSFPSGHSSASASMYGSIAAYIKKKWAVILAAVIIVLVGFSRITVGVHYPTDVICGWALGIAAVLFVPWLQKKINNDPLFYAILLIAGLPGFFYCRTEDFFSSYGMMLGTFSGILFEEKYVKFDNTRNVIRIILRLAAGVGLFFGLNSLLKLPFSKEFLESGTMMVLIIRAIRYAVVTFILIGIYPIIFKYTAKIGSKQEAQEESTNPAENEAPAPEDRENEQAVEEAEGEELIAEIKAESTEEFRTAAQGDTISDFVSLNPDTPDPNASRMTEEYIEWMQAQRQSEEECETSQSENQ